MDVSAFLLFRAHDGIVERVVEVNISILEIRKTKKERSGREDVPSLLLLKGVFVL